MDVITATLAGSAVGVATGLLPGLHVNTIAAIAFVILPQSGPIGAVFLLAVGTVHTIVNILPATYLGAPDDDDVVAVLPAHRLLLAGRGPEAVSASVHASVGGAILAVGFGMVLLALLRTRIAGWLEIWTPIVLLMAMATMWMQEAKRGWHGPILAVIISVIAGTLGWVSSSLPLRPFVTVPPTALLPLLSGMFGAAGLSMAMQRPLVIPQQLHGRGTMRRTMPTLFGSTLAGITALMPGLTAAVATALVPGIRGRPVHAVAAMSAINTAHAVMAIIVLLGTGRIRTGLADAVNQWAPATWVGWWPSMDVAVLLVVMLAATVIGALATLWLGRWIAPRADQMPARVLAVAGLLFLTATVAVLSGWIGLVLYALAIMVGRLPIRLGVRRVHLVACLIVPALIWTWT